MIFLDQRLRASERLKGSKAIATLFRDGQAVKAYPLLLLFQPVPLQEGQAPARMGFVAPKKAFRHAHDRNFIKRRMREAYRLQKAPFYSWLAERDQSLDAMLIFTGRELPDQAILKNSWRKLLRRLDPVFFD